MSHTVRTRSLAPLFLLVVGCASVPSKQEAAHTALSPQEFVEAELISGVPWETSERTASGGLFYDAYFNGENRNLLTTPVRTFEAYCEGKGGKLAELSRVQVSAKALAAEPVPEDIAAALRAAQASFGKFGCESGGQLRWSASIEPRALRPVGEAPNWKLRMHVTTQTGDELESAASSEPQQESAGADEEVASEEASAGAGAAESDAETRCARGELASCEPVQRYRSAALQELRLEQPLASERRSCLRGKASACAAVGAAYARGDQTKVNLKQALGYFRRGCARGDATSCTALGLAYEAAQGTRKDALRATRAYSLGCRRGGAVACNNLGAIYARGERAASAARARKRDGGAASKPSKREHQRALGYFQQGCDKGEPIACTNAGAAQLAVEVAAAKPDAAAELFTRACDAGDPVACAALARLYVLGSGVEKSPRRARQLYDLTCNAGVRATCRSR